MAINPIEQDMNTYNAQQISSRALGKIGAIAQKYTEASDRLLGFALSLSYEQVQFTTCDPWKRKCGGVARNQFILIKVSQKLVNPEDYIFCHRLILARITESIPTPVEREIQGTVFQIHKLQPIVDPITQKELQWSALKASIIGTYYDDSNGNIGFGNDIDTFFAPLAYEVYVPTNEDLSIMINCFSANKESFEIGALRYTETPSPMGNGPQVPVNVSVEDFVGKDYGHRTALFGKTRFGKSNTIKIVADTIMKSESRPGQIIFDPSGEYTYYNPQDYTSLFMLHSDKCVRYSLDLHRTLPPEEIEAQLTNPLPLFVDFYKDIAVGHGLISQLFDTEFSNRPNYMVPILNWTPPLSYKSQPSFFSDPSDYWHFWRSVSLWWGCLKLAGYEEPNLSAHVNFPDQVKEELSKDDSILKLFTVKDDRSKSLSIPIKNLPGVLKRVAQLWQSNKNLFPNSKNGDEYFNPVEKEMLKILLDDGSVSGKIYFGPFSKFHSIKGSNVFNEIADYAEKKKTVFIDFAKSNSVIRSVISERICKALLDRMMDRFSSGTLDDLFVVLYFEEAHKLFPKTDDDLNNVYNIIAKEGAKFHLSMVYATQSMTTLSPDLLKNTENFIIGHLDDDREVREVTRKRAFRDMAEDVERIQSKGYVRMLSVSHKFALPVQIKKFEDPNKVK